MKSYQSGQSNGNAQPSSNGSVRRRQNGGAGSKRTTPVPPPRHASIEGVKINFINKIYIIFQCVATNAEQLRAFGRPLAPEELAQLNLNGNGSFNASPAQIPMADLENGAAGSYSRKVQFWIWNSLNFYLRLIKLVQQQQTPKSRR